MMVGGDGMGEMVHDWPMYREHDPTQFHHYPHPTSSHPASAVSDEVPRTSRASKPLPGQGQAYTQEPGHSQGPVGLEDIMISSAIARIQEARRRQEVGYPREGGVRVHRKKAADGSGSQVRYPGDRLPRRPARRPPAAASGSGSGAGADESAMDILCQMAAGGFVHRGAGMEQSRPGYAESGGNSSSSSSAQSKRRGRRRQAEYDGYGAGTGPGLEQEEEEVG